MKQPELGDYIANLRKEQGLTQEELVDLCNINVRTIQRIEAGDVTPRNYTIKNILRALGRSFEEVLDRAENQEVKTAHYSRLLTRPKLGLITGILGILYIVVSIPFFILDLAYSINGTQLVSNGLMLLVDIAYFLTIAAFYISLISSLNLNKTSLLKYCVAAFLTLQAIVVFSGTYLYSILTNSQEQFAIVLMVVVGILYGVSYLVISIPFILARKEFDGWFRSLGWIALGAGAFHVSVLLFPIGVAGVLAFEVLLIILLLNASYKEKESQNLA